MRHGHPRYNVRTVADSFKPLYFTEVIQGYCYEIFHMFRNQVIFGPFKT